MFWTQHIFQHLTSLMLTSYLLLLFLTLTPHKVSSSSVDLPYTLGIRDSIMIAHSFHENPAFGPAGKLHGATYTCDVEFKCKTLTPSLNWVMDIGKATELLSKVLSKYNLKNLDDIFPSDTLTTTEFMARQIHSDLVALLREELVMIGDGTCGNNEDGIGGGSNEKFQARILVKLWESHKAWATYEADIH